MANELSDLLRRFCSVKKNWTLTRLAYELATTPYSLSRYIHEEREWPPELLPTIRECLDLGDSEWRRLIARLPPEAGYELEPVPPEMCLIPAGKFLMGSDTDRDELWREDEVPQHEVDLPGFHIAKGPVTNFEYSVFVASGRRQTGPTHWEGKLPPSRLDDHPVVHVNWHDALDYCEWLTKRLGKPYRLPTEAEWEKAARGTKGDVWPWGNSVPRPGPCNYCAGFNGVTTPVGAYSPQGDSPYGCKDMAGNVWEWTSSLHRPYPYRADDGREDRNAIGARVARGGSYVDHERFVRCACRGLAIPVDGVANRGFRVAMSED